MNYSNDALISALAAEYVLGTLRGSARDRFEYLRITDPKVEQAIYYWEAQLNPMATDIESITPSDDVWEAIVNQLGFPEIDESAIDKLNEQPVIDVGPDENVPVELAQKPSANQAWKLLSGFAVAASFVLAILFYQMQSAVETPTSIAVFSNEEAQTVWSVEVREKSLFVRSTQNLPRLANNDYQLWIVPASGDAPISLGVLEQSGGFAIVKPDIFDDVAIAALAVSLEPKGGSPNGAPTEVLYIAELASI